MLLYWKSLRCFSASKGALWTFSSISSVVVIKNQLFPHFFLTYFNILHRFCLLGNPLLWLQYYTQPKFQIKGPKIYILSAQNILKFKCFFCDKVLFFLFFFWASFIYNLKKMKSFTVDPKRVYDLRVVKYIS